MSYPNPIQSLLLKGGRHIVLYNSTGLGSNSWKFIRKIDLGDRNHNCQLSQHPITDNTHIHCKNKSFFISETGIDGHFRQMQTEDPSNLPEWHFGGSSFFQDVEDMYQAVSRCDKSSGRCKGTTRTMFIYRLNNNWTDYHPSNATVAKWVWPHREASFIFRQGGFFYLTVSGTAGWEQSKTWYRRAKTLAELADATEEEVVMHPSDTSAIKSCGSQFRFFMEAEPGKWLFGGDRYPNDDPIHWNAKYGRHVMTPVNFMDGVPHVYWKEQFRWDSYNYTSGDYDEHNHNGCGHGPCPKIEELNRGFVNEKKK